jgi:RNA polymerase sigma-70 factor (ECF subfamily)
VELVSDGPATSREDRFTDLARVVADPMRRYLVRRTDPEMAQDVLADAFLVVWRRLDDVPADDPVPWCIGVARGCLANALRAVRRQQRLVQRLGQQPRDGSEPGLDDTDLHEALGRLPGQDRELVQLWAWEQLAPQEIAVVLGITPNAARIRLHRARTKLAVLLDGRHGDGGAGQEQVKERRRR